MLLLRSENGDVYPDVSVTSNTKQEEPDGKENIRVADPE